MTPLIPLTPMQEMMLSAAIADPYKYVTSLHYRIQPRSFSELCVRFFELIQRHEILRTLLVVDGGRAFMSVSETLCAKFSEVTQLPKAPFCLDPISGEVPIHIYICGDELLFVFSHILLDGWSAALIMKELLADSPPAGQAPPFRYYIKWLKTHGDAKKDNVNCEQALLPFQKQTAEYDRGELSFILADTALIKKAAASLGVPLGRFIEAVWGVLCARYAGGDVLIASVDSGRIAPVPGITKIAGMFVSTLPLEVKIPDGTRFCDFVKSFADGAALKIKQGYQPFDKKLNAIISVELAEFSQNAEYSLIKSQARLITDFDVVAVLGEEISVRFEYNTHAFSRHAAELIRDHLINLVTAVLAEPEAVTTDIDFLTQAEKAFIHRQSFDGDLLAESNIPITEKFRAIAQMYPQKPAIYDGRSVYTYADIDRISDNIAHSIAKENICGGVGICLPRSAEYVIAEIGIMKAGCYFLPIDPDLPKEKYDGIIETVSPVFVITSDNYTLLSSSENQDAGSENLYEQLALTGFARNFFAEQGGGRMLSLCGLTRTTTQLCGKIAAKTVEEAVRTCSEDLPAIKPESPAYVIMTSGTTGKPKGVLVAHRSLSHYLAWAAKTYYNSSDISSVLIYGFTFDGAFGSIYGQLLAGGTLHILDNETRFDIRSIAEFCLSKKITHIDLPAAMLPEFTRYMSFHTKKNNLRFIITGGEQVKPFTDCGTAVSNEYGPTECTVCVTQSFLTADGGINIGNELPNTKIYILNDKKQLCPLGVFGECYVAGVQVALGYLGGENNKAFTANPFGDGQFELVFTSVRDGFAADFFAEQGGRRMLSLGGLTRRTTQLCEKQTQEDARLACEDMFLYRTGDRVRFIETSDGYVLEFSGRTDGQIKLNGFRIETGEIEQAALKCDGVTGAVALLRGTYIALYAVCGDAAILEKRLREALPHYMQPVVIPVPFIPLTESGKPDQAKLSEYKPVSINDDPENISPAGKILCGLVFDLIGVKVSAADNFTAIGGNSVTAMKLSFLLAEKNIELSPADIIRSKNFAELSDKMVEREGSAKHNHDIAFTPPDSLKSMIYLSQKFGETLYAVTAQKPCASSRGEVETRIKQAAEMHDILRCTFAIDPQGNISAIIKTSPNIKFLGETEDLPDSIDPLGETLAYVSLRDDRLTVRYHHIILDGYSINLLLSELAEGIFPETAESYSDFANAISDEKIKEKDHEFYGQALRNCEAVTLFDNTNPPEKLCALRCFDDEFLEEIRIAACKIPVTPAVFIMAAFGVFLCAYGDTNKTYIPVVASFRNTGGLMGCAAQTFPAVFSAHADFKDFNRAATELRDSLTAATAHVNIPEEYLGLPYIFVDDSDSTSGSLNDSQNYGLVITSGGSILYDENSVAPALLETIKTRFFAALKNALSGRTSVFTEGEYYLVRDVFPFGNTVGKKHDYLDKINDAKALGIAEQLRHLGIGPGDCVMAEEERRDEALLSYAGISLAGAAFLPMDTDLPRQRKDEITADCRPAALIKNGEITAFARADAMKFDSDTAYIIYTSGTTGKPKGVPISKTALQSQINWTIDEFSFSKDDIILHYINFAFDPSVWVIYSAFASGAKTAVVPEDIRALPQKIAEFITERKITIAVLPAAAAYDILDNLKDNSLRLVFLGGDKINIPKRTNYTQSIVFINLYGPTETCINASFYRLPTDARQTACIGKPVSGTNIYILDKAGQPSPVGIKGEIYIGGDKLSGGYINRPTETASAFIVHAEFGRLYKTGDLAAWNPDGTVDFFGRSDRQVKIRGFRVELSEIEAAVSAAAKSPAAVTYKNGILIGFAGGAFSQKQIMDTLRGMIPAFMLPNRIVKTAQLPLTANGKIDYTGLIAPPETTDETPLGSTEKLVAEAFEEVLSLPAGTAGRNSDFFALGGHSLKLFALTGALAARGLLPGINDILRSPVVADLAEIVDETSVNRRNNANKNVIFDESAYADYVASCESVDMSAKRKADRIMITGATGFLGAHLLREVYRETSAQIFLPVRGETARIKRVLDYYFPGETFDFGRMNIFTADISDKQPEIPEIKGQIDIIYHSAADIRHYAPPQESYKANVAATEHMIRYAKSCNAYLAHISTASAVNKPVIAENDHENGDIFENIYQQTKQKAEQIIMAADNLRYGIYRVGNITPSLEYRVHAQNAESNSYLRLLTLLIKTRTLPDFGGRSGYCFADSAAKAIVLIAQRAFFDNHVFHITNPNILTFRKIFDIMKIEEITDCDVVPDELRGIYAQRAVEKKTDVSANIMNEATLALLRRLGFEWIAPDIDYLKCFTAYHE